MAIKRFRFVFGWILLISGMIGGSARSQEAVTSQRSPDLLTASVPQDSSCEIQFCKHDFGGRGGAHGFLSFRGLLKNRTEAPVPVEIQAGFKEPYTIHRGGKNWLVQGSQKATVETGDEGFIFHVTVLQPQEARESIRRGFIVPWVEVYDAATGQLLDATVSLPREDEKPAPVFDAGVMAGKHQQTVKGYEIIWSATLASPGSMDPARFQGKVLNPQGKNETIFLRAGFVNRLEHKMPGEGWSIHSESEVRVSSSDDEIPFEMDIHCPPGIYVGIANQVYEGQVWLWTEAERETMRLAEEASRQPRLVPVSNLILEPQVHEISILEATYSYTQPGLPDNAGHFEYTLKNAAAKPQKIKIRCGFIRTPSPDLLNPYYWHFKVERDAEIASRTEIRLQDDVKCHVQMESLVDSDRYRPYILVLSRENNGTH